MVMKIGGLIGLIVGIVCGLSGWYYGRQQAKKERGLDELHNHIWQKARSYSWYVTLIAIYLLLFLYIFGLHIKTVAALSILLFIHLFSWAISGLYLSLKVYKDSKTDKKTYSFLMAFFILFGLAFFILISTGTINVF